MNDAALNYNEKQLSDLVEREQEPIYEISSIFPFTILPTVVKIFRNKIIIVRSYIPITKYEFPILVEDLKTVTVTTSIMFASLLFEIKGFEPNPALVTYLRVHEALEARRIILGLILLKRKKISTHDVPTEQLVEDVKRLG